MCKQGKSNVLTSTYLYTSEGYEHLVIKLADVVLGFKCLADSPEDSTMGRGFADVHRIKELVKKAYQLGQQNPGADLDVVATQECID
jgi:N12 class adenine-specific DNA methylase